MKHDGQKSLAELMQRPLPRSTDWMDRVAEDQLLEVENKDRFTTAMLLLRYRRLNNISDEILAERISVATSELTLILQGKSSLSQQLRKRIHQLVEDRA